MKNAIYSQEERQEQNRVRSRISGLSGSGVSPYKEAGIINIDFDYLQENGLALHSFTHLDLSVARTNAKYLARGTYIQFLNMTSGGSLYVSFNKQGEPIPFDDVQQWESPFYQVFITNTAQAGVSCDMLVMINGRYTPYYKTKAVSPLVTNSPNVKSVLINNVATLICASNNLRRSVYIASDDANSENIYLGKNNAVTVAFGANAGFPLSIGGQSQFLSPYYTGNIYGICASGGQYVRIWENFE